MRLLALAVALDVLTTVAGLARGLGEAGLLTSLVYARLGLAAGALLHYMIEYDGFRFLHWLVVNLRPDVGPSSAIVLSSIYPALAAGHNLGILLRIS
ncbi:MAG: hypothetical protein GSR84_04470 [Desulfurococcales archaeon]|nr:hypothetical protein [Desulfurococcales archaeon]